mmetsp:Transcript_70513/g.223393  ORF Transcript_70513/g.223393 Transcript_70513/m.223393 type:complete len:299 (-) Transcript_70513:794-1690(-)
MPVRGRRSRPRAAPATPAPDGTAAAAAAAVGRHDRAQVVEARGRHPGLPQDRLEGAYVLLEAALVLQAERVHHVQALVLLREALRALCPRRRRRERAEGAHRHLVSLRLQRLAALPELLALAGLGDQLLGERALERAEGADEPRAARPARLQLVLHCAPHLALLLGEVRGQRWHHAHSPRVGVPPLEHVCRQGLRGARRSRGGEEGSGALCLERAPRHIALLMVPALEGARHRRRGRAPLLELLLERLDGGSLPPVPLQQPNAEFLRRIVHLSRRVREPAPPTSPRPALVAERRQDVL